MRHFFFGKLIRLAFFGGLAAILLVTVVGSQRVKGAWVSIRDHVRSNVDGLMDSRAVLIDQIDDLREEYPKRIAGLRCSLAEIDRDLAECEQQAKVAAEVAALCASDREVLQARMDALPPGGTFEFRAERLDREEALRRAARIAKTEQLYRERLADLDGEEGMLRDERARLRGELASTEGEFREFQSEATAMLREIDALKRKERLVELAERRQSGRKDLFSEQAGALATLEQKIDRRRIQLEERLRALGTYTPESEYEARARLSIARQN